MKKRLFKQVSIIGLGLIGSSIALSIKKNKLAGKTIGYAKSLNTRKKAKKLFLFCKIKYDNITSQFIVRKLSP